MRVLLTGASGFLGSWIRLHVTADWVCIARNAQQHPASFQSSENHCEWVSCDLTEKSAVQSLSSSVKIDAIIHLAGNKDIEWCEKYPEEAKQINCEVTSQLLHSFSVPMLFFSSDYVFNGQCGGYLEEDQPDPQTVYGATKLAAEVVGRVIAPERFCILRAGAIYSLQAGFLKYLYAMLSAGKSAECFHNAIYTPTSAMDVATFIQKWIDEPSSRVPVSHLAGDALTRFEFAKIYADIFRYDQNLIQPVDAQGRFFPNLSLNDNATRTRLSMPKISHQQSLQRLHEMDKPDA